MARAARTTEKRAAEKAARQWLSVLELAQALGSVSEACRRRGMDRTSCYERRRRFHTHGSPPELVHRIRELALLHPAYGCNWLEALLALEARWVSAITIQKILHDKRLDTRHERWLVLERRNAERVVELSPGPQAFLEKLNLCFFRERHVESARPGEPLSAESTCTPRSTPTAPMSSASSTSPKQPEAAVAVLHNDVLPFYAELDLPVAAILTDNGREFCGTERHPYELFVALSAIEHRRTRITSPKPNGFVERFRGAVLETFCKRSCGQRSTTALRRCRPIWTASWPAATVSGPTSATTIGATAPRRRSIGLSNRRGKKRFER